MVYLRLGSLNALYRLVREYRLPHGRRGRLYLFDTRKIDRWVESCGVVDSEQPKKSLRLAKVG